MKRLFRWLLSRLLPRTEAENDYYAWADQRLDELAETARLTREAEAEAARQRRMRMPS